MLKEYAQLYRAHTAPLEAVPAMVGAAISVGTFWSWEVAAWGVFGLLYHLAGYGMNSYMDWVAGDDKDDPHKQHHPLNSGRLSKKKGREAVIAANLQAITFSAVLLAHYKSIWGTVALIAMVLAGFSYNKLSKRTVLKPLPISIAHTLVFLVPVITIGTVGGEQYTWLMAVYILLWVVFQIGVSGELKDITQDEENLLLSLGAEVSESWFKSSLAVWMFSMITKLGQILVALLIVYLYGADIPTFMALVGLMALSASYAEDLVKTGEYNRDRVLKRITKIEMFSLFGLLAITVPFTSLTQATVVAFLSGLWVTGLNKYQWGQAEAPAV